MLSNECVIEYLRKAQEGDEKAKEIILKNNSGLIKSIVRRFIGKGVEYEDLYQIACIGFIKAINNFDESFGVKFSTYTVPMIIGEIKRYIRDNGAIKVSRTLKILANKINRFVDEYQTVHSIPPSVEIIAQKFEVAPEEVVVAMDSSRLPLSIFEKYEGDEEGQELIDRIPQNEPEDYLTNKLQLKECINSLNERERKIIVLRYFRDKTQTEIAKDLGVSQVQVSRLENKILEKMRKEF